MSSVPDLELPPPAQPVKPSTKARSLNAENFWLHRSLYDHICQYLRPPAGREALHKRLEALKLENKYHYQSIVLNQKQVREAMMARFDVERRLNRARAERLALRQQNTELRARLHRAIEYPIEDLPPPVPRQADTSSDESDSDNHADDVSDEY